MLKCFPVKKGEVSIEPSEFLVEATTYQVEVEADELYFVDVPLKRIGNTNRWELRTPFAVGEAGFRVIRDGTVTQVPISVAPNPYKIEDQETWEAMLIDLLDWSEALLGHQGVRDGTVEVGEMQNYLLLEALYPLMKYFEKALRHLFEHLRQRTITPDTPLTLIELRAPFPLTQIATNPLAVSWMRGRGSVDEIPIVEAPFVQQTFDHPVNRYIRWLVEQVLDRLMDALTKLRDISSSKNEESRESNWRYARASVLEGMADRLRDLLWQSPLIDIEPAPLEDAAFLVILNDPLYATVHKYGRLLCNQSLSLQGKDFASSMSRSFDIYELWCFRETVRQFETELGMEATYRNVDTVSENPKWGTIAEFAIGIEVWQLEYNATFPHYIPTDANNSTRTERYSLLGEQRPDIVVYYANPSANKHIWMALDAKYRTSKDNLLDAFSSAFAYNQSLLDPRFGGHSIGCYLLTPKSQQNTQKWFGDEFASTYPFGAFVLHPRTIRNSQLADFIIQQMKVSEVLRCFM